MKSSGHRKRNIALLFLLAVFCIGGVELAACRHFAPEVYRQITAPVRQGVQAVGSFCRAGMDSAASFWGSARDQAAQLWADLTAPKEDPDPPEDSQIASDPIYLSGPPVDDPLITELKTVDDQDILTGGVFDIVYFNQADETWADQPYGRDNIGHYGCGPTAMAMAVASMTDQETDPARMAQWAVEHGYWASRSGSYLSIVEGTARAYGLQAESFQGRTPDELIEELLSGKIMVALMGPGHFTNGGHFILLRGVTLTGQILVADPNSTDRSLTVWDPQLLLDELSYKTDSGAPLWSLSQPDDFTLS